MKETLTQQNVDDFFLSHFTKSNHYSDNLVHKFTSKYMKLSQAATIAVFNLSKLFDMPGNEYVMAMCLVASKKLSDISGDDLMNMYKANKPVWNVFENNVKTEWTALSGIKSAYNNASFKDDHFMDRLMIWADETGRQVNIKRVGLTRKIIVSKPIKELPWSK